ncbi:NAD(P)H-hydrate dehydratase [Thalassoglobus sp.]|uniref:NAD(P)H-hydrate dehydratase n=1 Tax=Thalassoglobus sp. TaxID=2795869 RepID=UPI003AA8AF07
MSQPLPSLPTRPSDGHKGTFGRVLIIGGSTGMSGAISLSGVSALRSGAGLVSLALPEPILPIVASYEPSYLCMPVPSELNGRISIEAQDVLDESLLKMDAAAIGPGLGRSENLNQLVAHLYQNTNLPVVFDADALNAIADQKEILGQQTGPRILTPHPGEFARLIDSETSHIQKHRETLAVEFAAKHKVILVLKGAGTIITDGKTTRVNETGNAGMGTGGTGDVLTGIIASLLGQKMPPLEAAQLGTYLHGLAGDLAAEKFTQRGMIASDLLKKIPDAWRIMQAE